MSTATKFKNAKPFNPVDIFKSEEEINQWLSSSLENDDPETFIMVLGAVVKHRGVAKVAKEAGINREHLYRIIRGDAKPLFDSVSKILNALGVKLQATAA